MFLTAKGELINMCEMYEQTLRVLVADFVCLAERGLEELCRISNVKSFRRLGTVVVSFVPFCALNLIRIVLLKWYTVKSRK